MSNINRLLQIMERLRDPENGCPWDLKQNFKTIAPYTIEEAYEVADAIERDNMPELKKELGDLLLQVVFHSQMASEGDYFVFSDVVDSICEKMIDRHPHVFSGVSLKNAAEVKSVWEKNKIKEQKNIGGFDSVLDGVPKNMPSILRSVKLQKKAAACGFDWDDVRDVFLKLDEEVEELREAVAENNRESMVDELGDVLFVCTNIARKLGIDPDTAIRSANSKFERRFKGIEKEVSESSQDITDLDIEQLEYMWQKQKIAEKNNLY
ncbi:MAG: nucleoside triphosphate pyrophosphohydrolase [Gammaproteobacteria bacterium]|nr:MAG: nucleoside triphosphate pyrophosphohydrolase [Gammaproteobacteria bacterium]